MVVKQSTKWLVRMGVLLAILIIFSVTPIGYLKIGIVDITFLTIPVIVGAIILDTKASTVLGFAFGVTSFIQAITGASPFGAALVSVSPVHTLILCVLPRTLMGFLTGLIFSVLNNRETKIKTSLASYVCALAAPLFNTVFFMTYLMVFFGNSDYISGMQGDMNIFAFVVAFVGINGLIEAVVACVVGGSIGRVLYRFSSKAKKG